MSNAEIIVLIMSIVFFPLLIFTALFIDKVQEYERRVTEEGRILYQKILFKIK